MHSKPSSVFSKTCGKRIKRMSVVSILAVLSPVETMTESELLLENEMVCGCQGTWVQGTNLVVWVLIRLALTIGLITDIQNIPEWERKKTYSKAYKWLADCLPTL